MELKESMFVRGGGKGPRLSPAVGIAIGMLLVVLVWVFFGARDVEGQATDSVRATADLTLLLPPGAVLVQGDTTVVQNEMTIIFRDERAQEAQAALNAQLASNSTPSGGIPNWVYGGALLVSAGFVLAYAFKSESVTVTQTVEGYPDPWDAPTGRRTNSGSTTTTTTKETERFPWCWPPGHRKRKLEGGDDE